MPPRPPLPGVPGGGLSAREVQRARGARGPPRNGGSGGPGGGDPPPIARNPPPRERAVPQTRLGRVLNLGGVAVGVGLGALAEAARAKLRGERPPGGRGPAPLLSVAHSERLVAALCRARGAALKMGQMLSLLDSSVLSPQLQRALERVRDGADAMPRHQTLRVLEQELGPSWREQLPEFQEFPFAAASLGQVHRGRLRDGTPVAVKVQYPGVSRSIRSDIENLLGLLRLLGGLPEGLFAEQSVAVFQRELELECDYGREAECAREFRRLLGSDPFFLVPEVFGGLSSARVLSMELGRGIPLDRCRELPQQLRDKICSELLGLFLRELLQFRLVQTDPNWANFLFDPQTRRMTLLDFGATRSFDREFTDHYIEVIRGAADGDRAKVLRESRALEFLTGFESREFLGCHTEAVLLLGEPFRGPQPFDFGGPGGGVAGGLRALLPPLFRGRLRAPPAPSLALHRKLGGLLLACAHLGGRVPARDIFERVYRGYWDPQNRGDTPRGGGDTPGREGPPPEKEGPPRVE